MRETLAFDLGLIESIHVNRRGVEQRAQSLVARRPIKRGSQVRAHVDAIQCIDLTTLDGSDTPGRVDRLCQKAKRPVRPDILEKLGIEPFTVGAVCVYHAQVAEAVACLEKTGVPVAAVSTFFPDGQGPEELKPQEIEASINAGAAEIDVVISRALALQSNWKALYDQIAGFRRACGDRAKLKVILGTGNLVRLERIAKASATAILAGADVIKTSTGKEATNATLPIGLVMTDQILRFLEIDPSHPVGFKPAGGIKTAKEAQAWMALMHEQLGEDWTKPERFRIGASSLLGDLERQLHHAAFGRYPAGHYLAIA
ncbi:deoxyribose-phosphate aldolase [Candidatus Uhrbacteria bacterium]|nr:deoxyribose-phosphate aldolase [Candidatus Uhrbacteria bacterium]